MLLLGWTLLSLASASLRGPSTQTGQSAVVTNGTTADVETQTTGRPFLLPLRRESVPVKRRGQVVSFKTSYSGIMHVGSPKPQEFRVVFDTGSGHVILPAKECESDSCLEHRRYSMRKSRSATAINMDGSRVLPGGECDQVTVGFGTGEVTGEFVRERVCLGPSPKSKGPAKAIADGRQAPCNDMHMIVAVEMSSQPFRSFDFDGIIGMGLSSLAMTPNFSFFQLAQQSNQTDTSQFGVFLNEGHDGEESEIAIGGYNPERVMEPLQWAPVAHAEQGHWQVFITSIRINGEAIEGCKQGCRGLIDTGTSHWGVPSPRDEIVTDLLTTPAGDILDCRLAAAPIVEIEIGSFNITLHPRSYMRRLPLLDGVTVGAKKASKVSVAKNATGAQAMRRCKPKVMAVDLPAPMDNVFIFGEPLLHRYYTVFDSNSPPRLGFGLAAHPMNTDGPDRGKSGLGALPDDVQLLL